MAYVAVDIQVPEIEYDLENNRASAVRVVRVTPWSAVDEAMDDLGGGAVATGNILLVTQPAKFPGKPHLWLHKVKVKPFYECVGDLDSNDLPEDPMGAEFTLTYNTPAFDTNDSNRPDLPDVPGETYLTIDRNMGLEVAAEDRQGLFWEAGLGGDLPFNSPTTDVGHPVPIDTGIRASVSVADLRVSWHRVKNPPRNAIMALQGMVNDRVFMGYSKEQLLFVGCQESKQFMTDGTSSYILTYQFQARIPKFRHSQAVANPDANELNDELYTYLPEEVVFGGWNHFPRKGTNGQGDAPYWQKIYRRAGETGDEQTDADLLYIPGNFNYLFQPDPNSN